ncbi:hypothetical protein HNP38_001638 [Chryseobacterium defluvii]|uniref:DUF8201 domain-containing protein n=1 Tax=Chryseobacterium defluvii TaxID=160396 RepID=A0A840KAZ8_9FLAO|nr:hypothetical protein [Chryseobacterium defluvii]MBB4806366.1 hypothetical protein [Chryseobacterium defluvii]
MVLLLFSSILIIPVLAGWGKIVENISGALFDGISGKILSGIAGISIIWMILSFFVPLNICIEVATIALGLIYFFKDKLYLEFYRFSKKDSLLIAFISLIILFSGSFYPYIMDHFGYYVPTIQWITGYGLVKGISNLDLTLGQVSLWHIFQSGFSNFSDPFLRINAILLIIYSAYIIERKSWIQLCFLPVLLLFSQSPSPDLPAIVFSMVILNEIISGNKQTALLFGFSAFVMAIKPTMIWLPILCFLYSILVVRSGFKKLIPGTLIIILFFFKNIWTFGYPVFPVAVIDLNVSWKPNPEVLKISSQYAIMKTYDMQYSYQEIQQFSGWEYIKNWLFLNGIKSGINIFFILSLLIFAVFALIKKNKIISLIFFSVLIKSALVLYFSAQYRFFIDVFFVISFILLLKYFNRKRAVFVFSVFSIFFIGFLSFPDLVRQYVPSFRLGEFIGSFQKKQIYTPSSYEYNKFNAYKIGNLKFNISRKYPYNFDTPVPAISESYIFDDVQAGIFPQLIDETDIKKGFIWKTMDEKEKKEARNLIHTIKNTHP